MVPARFRSAPWGGSSAVTLRRMQRRQSSTFVCDVICPDCAALQLPKYLQTRCAVRLRITGSACLEAGWVWRTGAALYSCGGLGGVYLVFLCLHCAV